MMHVTDSASDRPGDASLAAPKPKALQICVLLTDAATAPRTLRCALGAAQGVATAEISALHAHADSTRDDPAREFAVKAAFDACAAPLRESQPMRWLNAQGPLPARIAAAARDADLLVVGAPPRGDAVAPLPAPLHETLLRAGRLTLVAPREAAVAPQTPGRHLIIGWKPGEAVRQTAQAALPWLRQMDRITVLWVETTGLETYEHDARAFFRRAGLDAEIVRLRRGGRCVGLTLLDEAARRGGDALLIGARQHATLWRRHWGGVTGEILARAGLPTFMMPAC
jgi:nucleotide-binding universal stress UspA family protein